MNTYRMLLCVSMAVLIFMIAMLFQSYVVDYRPTDAEGTVDREITWYYDGNRYSFDFSVPICELEGYQNSTILRQYSAGLIYPKFITPGESAVGSIAESFLSMTEGLSDVERIGVVNQFVYVAVDYCDDSISHGTGDYYQFPAETLASGKGDCEDMALLEISILNAMGYDSIPIISIDHCLVGVNIEGAFGNKINVLGTDYFLLEPTTGKELGESSSMGIPVTKGLSVTIFSILLIFSIFLSALQRYI